MTQQFNNPPFSGLPTPVGGLNGIFAFGFQPSSGFGMPQNVSLYEFFTDSTHYARLLFSSAAGGPFAIQTDIQPDIFATGAQRELDIIATNGRLMLQGWDNAAAYSRQRLFTDGGEWNITGYPGFGPGGLVLWDDYNSAQFPPSSGAQLVLSPPASGGGWVGGVFVQSFGATTKPALNIQTDSGAIQFTNTAISASPMWQFSNSASGGHLLPGATGLKDIGSAALKIRSLYAQTSLIVGANVLTLGVSSSPGIAASGIGDLVFSVGGSAKWQINASTSALQPQTDNTWDFGVASFRPRNAIFSGSITPGSATLNGAAGALWDGTGVPNAGLGANGDYYFRTDGGASTHIYFKSAGAWAGIV